MTAKLSRQCDKSHAHQQLVGGRAHDAAFYPLPLIRAICAGIQATRNADHQRLQCLMDRTDFIQSVTDSAGTIPRGDALTEAPASSVKRSAGGVLPIGYHQENFCARYIDEYTCEVLDPQLVQAAIMEELNYFNEKVWEAESKDSMFNVADHVHVRSRWVLCNKEDAASPDIRARLVACEINKDGKQDSFFASTPPLDSKKFLFARFAAERKRNGESLQFSFVDIRKAYFNWIPTRPVYIQFPKEMGLPSNLVGKLVRCAYGTRDAGAIWEDTYRGALEEMGFSSGIASPCCFHHRSRNLHLVVHGDDFTTMGVKADIDWFEKTLANHFELKIRCRLGEHCTGPQQIRILNRIVTLTKDGLVYEGDPRHVDLLAGSLGLSASNSVLTPGVKDPNPDYDSQKHDELQPQPLDDAVASKQSTFGLVGLSGEGSIRECDGPMLGRTDGCIAALALEPKTRPKISTSKHRHVSFQETPEVFSLPVYSSIYGCHPLFLAATSESWKSASSHADPFTAKSGLVMRARCAKAYSQQSKLDARFHRRTLLRALSVDHHGKVADIPHDQRPGDDGKPMQDMAFARVISLVHGG